MSSQNSPSLEAGESESSLALACLCQRVLLGVKPVEAKVPQGPAGRLAGAAGTTQLPWWFLGACILLLHHLGDSESQQRSSQWPPLSLGFLSSEAGIQQFLATKQLESGDAVS